MWLQNDGCPAHYAIAVRQHLNSALPGRWIGRLGPILWPARSPDLNPLDFYYWGYLKEKAYRTPSNSLEELRRKIFQAAAEINAQTDVNKLRRNFLNRCKACLKANGSHFEHFL